MRIAIIADTHFGARKQDLGLLDHFCRFYDEVFFPYLEDNDIRHVIHLGDLVDQKKGIGFQVMSRMRTHFLEKFRSNGIELMCLAGNHDLPIKQSMRYNAVREIIPQNVVDGPIELTYDGRRLLLLPWICDENREESERMIATSRASVVLGHLELEGFPQYVGRVSDTGMDPARFERFDLVLSGHFHTRSMIGNVAYIGAPYEMNWNDYDDPRGFCVLDTETLELEFVDNPNPIHCKVAYDDTDGDADFLQRLDYTPYRDKFVRVVVVRKTQPDLFEEFIANMEAAGVRGISLSETAVSVDDDGEVVIDDHEDMVGLICRAVDELQQTNMTDRLKALMTDLYAKATARE